jgi:hypothetical protein
VLHPAIVSDATTNTTATIFWTIVAPPLDTWNDNESLKQLSVY